MPELLLNPATLIAITVAAAAIVLYLREYFLRKKTLEQQSKISLETREKSIQLLKAAEEAQTKVIADGSYVTGQLIAEFKARLDTMVQNSQESITTSQSSLIKFMEDLQKRSGEFEEAYRKSSETRINQVFGNLETRLSDFLIKTEQQTVSAIELELKGARNLIEGYKQQQLKLIDENIIAMMEQTLNIVLAKKLSLKDQLDLVYEALERAKIDKFIV